MSEEEFDKIIKILIPSDSDNSIKDNFGRFDKGYSAEILFERIYSLLPWIKLITPLGQEQFPEKSKEEYQVPDYEIIFETGSPEKRAAVLIEAKMVDVKKEKHVLKKVQYEVLKKYANRALTREYFLWTGEQIITKI